MAGIQIPTYANTRDLPAAPNQLPSVRQTAAPTADQLGGNARVPTDYLGAGLRSAGNDLMDVGLQMQAREDADLVMRAETLLHEKLREQSARWSERRGVQAWNVTKDAQGWWDDESSKAAEGLNERQRAMFEKTRQRLRSQSLDSLSRFEADQRRSSLDESAQANVVASINFAAANPTDPAAIAAAREDVARAVDVRAGINGWVTARRDLEMGAKLTLLHKQVLGTLVDQNPAAAEAYLKLHEEEIDGAERAEIRKMVEGGTRLAKAQSFADQYDPAAGANEAEAIAAARKQFEGEDEKLAVNEVRSRFLEHRQARENAQKDALDAAYAERGPTGTIARISPSTWAKLGGDQQARLLEEDARRLDRIEARADRADRRADRKEREQEKEQERGSVTVWGDYHDEINDGVQDVEAFKRRVRADYNAGKLKERHAADLLRSVDANTDKLQVVNSTAFSTATQVVTAQKGWKKEKVAAFKDIAKQSILAEQSLKGRPLTTDEMRKITDDLMVEGTVEDETLWFDKDRRRFEVLGTDREDRWKPKNAAPKGPAAAQTKTINGKTYVKIGNDWFAK